ncbi:hypothetical protein DFQ01_103212 [Paenibacillus cellulosilyticus]|uniref:Uncharacterized protein n=1 Tax=Paenibacillus cellulosilyticus TaxID=375489 RepID=A0A2V2Z642_9BACL|nr:hypothetical protein [Paenibacillus cellulosilyticus]PWW06310.1 hypothetical protein DFQ01_103212 [Paenibacillus cellulosilyticus]QKS42945.1 hypothetical protein HUB94_00135 [Paenibacillus cellulosilyticus]QKS43468.1 hypothetical protein HUB94_02800 [Paenibacillus cellulosilyticus]QKS46329.1 hypothetical protein HUB94_19165 [Paenibacillus cellulosilyticus]
MEKNKLLRHLENEIILYMKMGIDFSERMHELVSLRQRVWSGEFDDATKEFDPPKGQMLWELMRDIEQYPAGTSFVTSVPGWGAEIAVVNINGHHMQGKTLKYTQHTTNPKLVGKPVNLAGNAIKWPWYMKIEENTPDEHGRA